jgi:hypothetical protein
VQAYNGQMRDCGCRIKSKALHLRLLAGHHEI